MGEERKEEGKGDGGIIDGGMEEGGERGEMKMVVCGKENRGWE